MSISIFQYSETNVVHFLFSLLRIKGLYMIRAFLAHPQEVPPEDEQEMLETCRSP
jgi:hypothetical protein